ncbi:MAG: DUF1475 family protein [Proteobacteria bacterium]|nr:DUF1475 family protein [Pseudomonadota bacterium]
MTPRITLKLLFGAILATMLAVTAWASLTQPVWQWGGLTRGPDRAWTIATLCDAYAGFLTFYAWVCYRERAAGRVLWFVLIMLLGNIAMSAYALRALARLGPDEPLERLLARPAR